MADCLPWRHPGQMDGSLYAVRRYEVVGGVAVPAARARTSAPGAAPQRARIILLPGSDAGVVELFSVLAPDDELQSGPHVADRTHLHIHQAPRQGQFTDDVLGDVGRHLRGL